jgi:hypothetical protein
MPCARLSPRAGTGTWLGLRAKYWGHPGHHKPKGNDLGINPDTELHMADH